MSYIRLEVTVASKWPHKTKGPCEPAPQAPEWPRRHPGAQARQLPATPRSLPGLEAVTSRSIGTPSGLLLLDHLQLLQECRRCSSLHSRAGTGTIPGAGNTDAGGIARSCSKGTPSLHQNKTSDLSFIHHNLILFPATTSVLQ